jgi:type II secretory ATPase GspE/PulE/Tfp pilus assembly ATPase PilB-like protein
MVTQAVRSQPRSPGAAGTTGRGPLDERRFTPPLTVVLGLLDGDTKNARLTAFSPRAADVIVEVDNAWQGAQRIIVPAERIAYVGFSGERSVEAARRLTDPVLLRIHVAGGTQFAVELSRGAAENPIGYYAVPVEEETCPFQELFFYAHGVNAREKHEPLGELLVFEGMLSGPELATALSKQNQNRTAKVGEILVEEKRLDPEMVEAAAQLQQRKRMRIGEVLVEAGLASEDDIKHALALQKQRAGKRIGELLVEMEIVTENDLARALANKFHMPFGNLDTITVEQAALDAVSNDLIEKYGFMPITLDARSITVAISDPLATEQIDVLRMHVQRRVNEIVVTPSQLKAYVANHLSRIEKRRDAVEVEKILAELTAEQVLEKPSDDKPVVESDSAVIRLVNQIILDAIRKGASDIHIEPNGHERPMIVRVRVDGECSIYQEIPPVYRNPVVARFKIMAELDIAEKRKPQDGKIRFPLGNKKVELRVATIPTVNGNEDVVLRILASSKPMPLEQMGLSERNLTEMRRLVQQPYGLLLCVGPTGSGKTTTLHAALGAINTNDTKIWTAEDPVEITQPGLRQVQVHPKIGFTFAAALRSFLRADPDVIMVGEMRDTETAGIAVECSLTGHLVLSTLHTNSAPETITRLLDMGLDPFSFGDALLGILAQRLARKLCTECRERYMATSHEYVEFVDALGEEDLAATGVNKREDLILWRGRGCSACGNTGYRGRLALHELLVANDDIKRSVARREPVDVIRETAIESGMATLRTDGLQKCLVGQTDMRQVQAVCSR